MRLARSCVTGSLKRRRENAQFFVPGKEDRLQFDLTGYVRSKLTEAGLQHIDLLPHDTCAMSDMYFSNRRRNHQGLPDYGRNASVIMLQP